MILPGSDKQLRLFFFPELDLRFQSMVYRLQLLIYGADFFVHRGQFFVSRAKFLSPGFHHLFELFIQPAQRRLCLFAVSDVMRQSSSLSDNPPRFTGDCFRRHGAASFVWNRPHFTISLLTLHDRFLHILAFAPVSRPVSLPVCR